MSHKGNKLILIPNDVNVTINKMMVLVKGPLGELKIFYPNDLIKIEQTKTSLKLNRINDEKQTKMYHGTINANITNAINGVKNGYKKVLKIVGVGYKAQVVNGKLILAIGYNQPVELAIPTSLKLVCPTPTQIEISGCDKVIVGEFAAKIRALKKPEPYKGKGIMYIDEHIIRKVGKTAESTATTSKPATATKAKK